MKVVVAATIMLQVLAVGVQADPAGLLTCVRRPLWLVRIIVAMFIAVPLLAAGLVKISSAPRGMKVSILLMAMAAVAPLLPRKLLKMGVGAAFAVVSPDPVTVPTGFVSRKGPRLLDVLSRPLRTTS